MRASALITLLCNTDLPVSAYDFEQHSLEDRAAMLERVFAKSGAVVTKNPAVTMVEIEAEHVMYLITQPGHFAHPSIIARSLCLREGVKTIQVSGFTAAAPDIMATWLDQFRVQDDMVRQSLRRS